MVSKLSNRSSIERHRLGSRAGSGIPNLCREVRPRHHQLAVYPYKLCNKIRERRSIYSTPKDELRCMARDSHACGDIYKNPSSKKATTTPSCGDIRCSAMTSVGGDVEDDTIDAHERHESLTTNASIIFSTCVQICQPSHASSPEDDSLSGRSIDAVQALRFDVAIRRRSECGFGVADLRHRFRF